MGAKGCPMTGLLDQFPALICAVPGANEAVSRFGPEPCNTDKSIYFNALHFALRPNENYVHEMKVVP
jgi:hypothetical protein